MFFLEAARIGLLQGDSMSVTDDQKKEIISFTRELVRLSGGSGDEGKTASCVHRKMESLGYNEVVIDEYIEIKELLMAAEIYGNICQSHV